MRSVPTVAATVIAALLLSAPAQAAESAHARHVERVLRAKVVRLHGARAPGCWLVQRRCAKYPNPTTAQIHRYFETLRRMVMPRRAAALVTTGRPYQPPAGTATVRPGATLAAIAQCESTNNPRAVDPTGTYTGLYQFDDQTWHSVGGTGRAMDASAGEQTARAAALMARRGTQPWPRCGR